MSDSTINLAALGRFMLYGGRFETTVLTRQTSRATSTSHSIFYIPGIREFESAGASVTQLTLRRLMSYIYGAPILDVSRSHTTTQHSR